MRVLKEIGRRARRTAAFLTFLLVVAPSLAFAASQDAPAPSSPPPEASSGAADLRTKTDPASAAPGLPDAPGTASTDLSAVPVPASSTASSSSPSAREGESAAPNPAWRAPSADGSTDSTNSTGATTGAASASQPEFDFGGNDKPVDSENATPTGANAPRGTTDGSETFVGPQHGQFGIDFEWPKSEGQFGVVYDLSTYSSRFPDVDNPQNAIVNWIMFDAREDFWRKEPFSLFSASRDRLFVYHKAEVQRYVSNVVDRFLDPAKRDASFSIKVIALKSPDWRVRLTKYLTPRSVAVVGNGVDVQGWLLDRSNMATVAAEIEKRSDYLLLNSVKNVVPNGETFGWAAASPARTFVKDIKLDDSSESGYATVAGSVDEGFRVEATPLVSTKGDAFEVLFRYQATVVEEMRSFSTRAPTATAPRQQATLERPQIVSCDVKGKIGAPTANAAIVDLGLVPMILPKRESESGGVVGAVSSWLSPEPFFYDVLLLIEKAN